MQTPFVINPTGNNAGRSTSTYSDSGQMAEDGEQQMHAEFEPAHDGNDETPRKGRVDHGQQQQHQQQNRSGGRRQRGSNKRQPAATTNAPGVASNPCREEDKMPVHGILHVPTPQVKKCLQESWNNLVQSGSVTVDPRTTFLLNAITACSSRFRLSELSSIFDALDDESPAKMRIASQFVAEGHVTPEMVDWMSGRVIAIENARTSESQPSTAAASSES